jgi:hypothetical protein
MGVDFPKMEYKLIIKYQNYHMQGTWKRGVVEHASNNLWS